MRPRRFPVVTQVGLPQQAASRPLLKTVAAYIALTKPRIIELLLVTTVPTMIVAAEGVPGLWLVVATVAGGTLAAAGANAFNMYVDRDIDKLMVRTQNRPLVTGAIEPKHALVFAFVLEIAAGVLLWTTVNPLAAILAVSACAFYVFVYTLWLKRTSRQNIVIGGAAGAVPVLVGWAAVTNSLGWAPVLLFALIFFWTPPHFWALAVRYADDYKAAAIPMMPTVASQRSTGNQIVAYALVVWAVTGAFHVVAGMGWLFGAVVIIAGGLFVAHAIGLRVKPSARQAMRLFAYSITFVTVIFGAMAIDQLVRSGV